MSIRIIIWLWLQAKQILSETEESFCEKLIDFLKIDMFFVVGCKGYLSEKDYEYLQEWVRYQEITLVLVESDETSCHLV